jgi:hypothetical protein
MKPTSTDISVLLLAAFAVFVLYYLSRSRLDSNLPLIFYLALGLLMSSTDRYVDSYLFGGGLASALVLRFEFMNGIFTELVLWLEMLAITFIAAKLTGDVFGLSL